MSKLLLMLVFASALAVFVVPSEGYGYSNHHHHQRCVCVPDRIACPWPYTIFAGRCPRCPPWFLKCGWLHCCRPW